MKSNSFTLPYNLTIIFYIKHISEGIIMQKGLLSIYTHNGYRILTENNAFLLNISIETTD